MPEVPAGRQTRGLWSHGATWVSAGAAALSAIVAAVALVVNSSSDAGSGPVVAAPVSTTTSPNRAPGGNENRSVVIEAVDRDDDEASPRYALRGTASIDAESEEVFVLARSVPTTDQPVAAGREERTAADWFQSNPAQVAEDGTWSAFIGRPPLPEGPVEFVPVVLPKRHFVGERGGYAVAVGGNYVGWPKCPPQTELWKNGPEYCAVLEAGEKQTYAP
jgi:hypothetical protein